MKKTQEDWKCNVCSEILSEAIVDEHVFKEYREGYRSGPYMDHMDVVKDPNMTRREYKQK